MRRSRCPGNELAVHDTMNELMAAGATVLHQDIAPVHVSGHGSADELKTVLALVPARSRSCPSTARCAHLVAHARWRRQMGVGRARIFVSENGDVLELERRRRARRNGKVEAGVVFVDGLGIGDDRRRRAARPPPALGRRRPDHRRQLHPDEDRSPEPEVIARGFAPEGPRRPTSCWPRCSGAAARCSSTLVRDGSEEHKIVQAHLHDEVAELVYKRASKRPLILPVVVDV